MGDLTRDEVVALIGRALAALDRIETPVRADVPSLGVERRSFLNSMRSSVRDMGWPVDLGAETAVGIVAAAAREAWVDHWLQSSLLPQADGPPWWDIIEGVSEPVVDPCASELEAWVRALEAAP